MSRRCDLRRRAARPGEGLNARLLSFADSLSILALSNAVNEHAIISVTDAKGRIVDVNDNFCAISEYRREELIGQPQSIVNSGYHPPAFFRDLWAAISAGRPWHGTVRNRSKSGRHYWVRSTIEPYCGEDGAVLGYVSVLTDVTGLVETQQSLSRARENEAALKQLLERSLHNIALDDLLGEALDILTALSWLKTLPKGGIFGVEGDHLVLRAQRGLGETLEARCATVRFGHCLCGRAAATRSIQHARCIDHRHEVTVAGMEPHGHYNVPIMRDETLLGVIVLYLPHDTERDQEREAFLNQYAGVLGLIMDLKQRDQQLRRTSQFLETTFANMSQGIAMFDGAQRLLLCNDRFRQIYGLAPQQVRAGTPLRKIITSGVAAGVFAEAGTLSAVRRFFSPRQPGSHLVRLSNGRSIRISHRRLDGGGWVATHDDVTDRLRAVERIAHMAHHDALTGLPNRAFLIEEIGRAAEALADGGSFNLLLLDLDRFKAVNDTLGHSAGDSLLKAVAGRLGQIVREADTVVRLGGDEFAILQLVSRDPRGSAAALAQRVIEAVGGKYELDGHEVVVGVSVGIACAPSDGADIDQLLRHADLALYRVKADGRNSFRFFDVDLNLEAHKRHALEFDLRNAISRDEFLVEYQTYIELATGAIGGAEALVRWKHPRRGLVPPDRFIPVAEETGIIVPLGRRVLRQACADAARWPATARVAVNLSPAQFHRDDIVALVTEALSDSGLSPQRLELEITESVLIQHDRALLDALHRLRGMGVSIALDDFGTGYSSLSYLRLFPFDKIKIDRTFVSEISVRPDNAAIVCAIAGLARSLNMRTTAEGVETREQLQLLRAAGCTAVQGFLLSRPVSDAQLVWDLAEPLHAAG